MDETIKQGKGALRLLLATMLAAMLIPWAPRAAWADENEAAAQTQTSEIADLLAAGDYVEGEALVVVDNAASRNSLRSRSVDPLSSAEPLMDASAETVRHRYGRRRAVGTICFQRPGSPAQRKIPT